MKGGRCMQAGRLVTTRQAEAIKSGGLLVKVCLVSGGCRWTRPTPGVELKQFNRVGSAEQFSSIKLVNPPHSSA